VSDDVLKFLSESGVSALNEWSTTTTTAEALRRYVASLNGAGPLDTEAARLAAVRDLKAHKVRDAHRLASAAFAERLTGNGKHSAPPAPTIDIDPWPDPVDGAALLEAIAAWFSGYVHLPKHAARVLALWVSATWFVGVADYAALLLLLSATKRCAKSLLLDLVSRLVRRGYFTSGTGITTAVVFRLNESRQPTLCIDEAEKLAGRHADRDLIGMLNAGYRRGARVQRCIEKNGDYEIREFNAFGFRALAAIGALWDTIVDRAVVIWLERKPQGVTVRRFASRVADGEGVALARQLRRWSEDQHAAVAEALLTAPRPDWLNDRSADNWATLFAVAAVAGAPWPERALETAQGLENTADERDHAELLVHDLWRLWNVEGWCDAVASGDLVEKLKDLETSPWGGYRDGRGITTHGLAAMLKPLGVRPRLARNKTGLVVRGYWLADLKPLYTRYPSPPQLLQLVQELLAEAGRAWVVPPVSHVTPVTVTADGEVDPDVVARDAMRDGA